MIDVSALKEELVREKEAHKALNKLYSRTGVNQQVEVFPFVLYPTYASTIVNGATKDISINSLLDILNSLVKETEINVTPMCLPFGTFMFSRKGDNLYINCYYKGGLSDIKYDSRGNGIEKLTIPMPNIITFFNLKKGDNLWQVLDAFYMCTPKTVSQLSDTSMIMGPNPSAGVYKVPFSNMYPNCKMCYGQNTMPVRFTDNLRGLDYYYQILTTAPFNSDLGINGLKVSYTPRGWFQHLATLKEFPYELLSTN